MKKESEKAIKELAEKGGRSEKADDALKYTQAALNLSHLLAVLDNMEKR